MLILNRRSMEAIRIGDEVTVTILGVRNGQVRVGVSAPRRVEVHRQEIYDRIQSERSRPAEAGGQAQDSVTLFRPC